MKRYNHTPIDTCSGCIAQNVHIEDIETDDGEWVKYKDVEKEMKKIWGDIMPPPGDILKSLIKGA
jgi:hypothetical protein